jgi:hypothetical protein
MGHISLMLSHHEKLKEGEAMNSLHSIIRYTVTTLGIISCITFMSALHTAKPKTTAQSATKIAELHAAAPTDTLSDAALVQFCAKHLQAKRDGTATPTPLEKAEAAINPEDPDAKLKHYCLKNPLKTACVPES